MSAASEAFINTMSWRTGRTVSCTSNSVGDDCVGGGAGGGRGKKKEEKEKMLEKEEEEEHQKGY